MDALETDPILETVAVYEHELLCRNLSELFLQLGKAMAIRVVVGIVSGLDR